MKLLYSILIICSTFKVVAQDSPYSVPTDSTNKGKKFIPTGIRLGADILGPVLYAFDNKLLSYEFTAEIDISNFYLIYETGHVDFAEKNDNVDYMVNGNFTRIGPEVNFLSADKELNNFSIGLRYAWSNFNEKIVGDITEDNWGAVPVNFDINNRSQWIEMTTGVKVRLWKGLFTGYIFRFRFIRKGSVPEVPFEPYYVPGYGLADRSSTWGFRYYLMYRIQWAKKLVKVK